MQLTASTNVMVLDVLEQIAAENVQSVLANVMVLDVQASGVYVLGKDVLSTMVWAVADRGVAVETALASAEAKVRLAVEKVAQKAVVEQTATALTVASSQVALTNAGDTVTVTTVLDVAVLNVPVQRGPVAQPNIARKSA